MGMHHKLGCKIYTLTSCQMPNNNNLQMLHAVESERIVIQCSDQIIWNNAHTNGTKYHENHSFILISLKKKNLIQNRFSVPNLISYFLSDNWLFETNLHVTFYDTVTFFFAQCSVFQNNISQTVSRS